jgi:hypothetical protein
MVSWRPTRTLPQYCGTSASGHAIVGSSSGAEPFAGVLGIRAGSGIIAVFG